MDRHRNRLQLQGGLRGLLIGGLALIAGLGAAAESDAAARYRLSQASSCSAVRDQLVDQIVEQLTHRSYDYRPRWRGRDIEGSDRPLPRRSATNTS